LKQLDSAALRRRVLMFYFAAGLNLLLGFYVISAGGAVAERGTLWLIALMFLAFAGLNYYMARTLARRWQTHVTQQNAATDAAAEQPKQ
jgi:hypothetical protein